MAKSGRRSQKPKKRRQKQPDKQVIELRGRAILVNQLYAAGIEAARPERDRGIDLIAYIDCNPKSYVSKPIQLRAFRRDGIKLDRKHAKFPGLILVLVCHLDDPSRLVTYALPYREAIALIDEKEWKWNSHKSYYRGPLGKELTELFQKNYRMTTERWRRLIQNGR